MGGAGSSYRVAYRDGVILRRFQGSWYEYDRFKSWLEYSPKEDAVFLFILLPPLTLSSGSVPSGISSISNQVPKNKLIDNKK